MRWRLVATGRTAWRSFCLALTLTLATLAWLAPGAVRAQGIESVLRPGDVIQGHAKWEDDCASCHVRFDRAAQDRRCMACHKEVGRDVAERAGYHGRIRPQPCRACHTDHKGRRANIVSFDQRSFDHAGTDFALRGRHAKVECALCHVAGRRWREAASDCNACHRKDDRHKGALGPRCADCHGEENWKEARFDHAKTRFALSGRHADAKCATCHRDDRFKETPRTCVACHRKEDDSAAGHKGRFGTRCESCHGTKAWKPAGFNHDKDTAFMLRGEHRAVKCSACHTGTLFKDKTGSACADCHRKDDVHKESLGRDCGACHSEGGWRERARFDHDKTRFALLGRHREAECKACHKSADLKGAPTECVACHRAQDKHEATLGTPCGSCHDERNWKSAPRFDHGKTRFALRNAHAAKTLRCESCHASPRQMRHTPTDCLSCHRKDDKHQETLGTRCEQCHSDRDWKVGAFDHRITRFPLLGRHTVVKCADCHTSARYKEAPRDCLSCHRLDDKHALKFGTACQSCHNARAWGLWEFDHNRRSQFVLDGAHRGIACTACHARPAAPGKAIAELGSTCQACHRKDDVHDGAFSARCEQCHFSDRWKRVRPRPGADAAPSGASRP